MSDYLITGAKGHGKSLVTVGRMYDALMQGRRVATNLDLFVEHMLPAHMRDVIIYRLPDHPTADDLAMIGQGSDKLDESTYGEVALDELATWINSRSFQDKGRQATLSWFAQSRKLRWNTNLIAQGPEQIDRQVRETLVDHYVSCIRTDKFRLPFIGSLCKTLLSWEPRPPKFHIGTVRYGKGANPMKVDRWYYKGSQFYKAYDTEQVFSHEYPHGVYCLLSPWHIKGRYERRKLRLREWLKAVWTGDFPKPPKPAPKPMHPTVALVAKLPPEQRIRHLKRLEEQGAI